MSDVPKPASPVCEPPIGSAMHHFLVGSELAQAGRYVEAEAALANAVLLAPELHIARYQLGLLQFTSGRAAVALVTWSPLFALPSTAALQRFVSGFAALAQDDFAQALARFREGLVLNTDNEPLHRDIRMLIERIEGMTPPAAAAEPQEASDGVHVLLSNYRRQGPLH